MDYSLSIQAALWLVCTACLNPYSNGLLSEGRNPLVQRERQNVLILILMDYSLSLSFEGVSKSDLCCLNPYSNGLLSEIAEFCEQIRNLYVLILILMDYSLSERCYL